MNALYQLTAMQGPRTTIILLNTQWNKDPGVWTCSYERDDDKTKLKMSVEGNTPEAAILAMYERLMAVSKGIPEVAPLGIEYKPDHPTEVPAYESELSPAEDRADAYHGSDDEVRF